MSSYIIRIELHGVSDYGALDVAMQQEQFQLTITSSKHIDYRLPTGTYYLPFGIIPTTSDTLRRAEVAVRRALQREPPAVRQLNELPAILVVDAEDGMRWTGLAAVS